MNCVGNIECCPSLSNVYRSETNVGQAVRAEFMSCACKEHTNATTHISTRNVHKIHTPSSPPALKAMLDPAIKLMITTDNIMVAKLATTPSLKLVSQRSVFA
jgi:hypothetical protein